MSKISIGLLGFGTVSGGFYHQLEKVSHQIENQFGIKPVVEKILVKRGDASQYEAGIQKLLVHEPEDLLFDSEIDIIVEAINGEEPAASYIEIALKNGKHVITANKAAVANHWQALKEASKLGGGKLFCEASVCGGIPVVETLKTLKLSDEVIGIEGIVNGTTNYILTLMGSEGIDYQEALARAKALGYSEQNPSADVDGEDAANKLAILCDICFDEVVKPRDIKKESIKSLTKAEEGLKVIASAHWHNGLLQTAVSLRQLPQNHPLYGVSGVENGLVIQTKGIGQIRLYGPGAGGGPTGTAMISDLVQLIQTHHFKA